ncbi:hypothetical protein Vafri_20726 [Volvox africanus]|uniref:RNase H type-1 domain-containing protein n=1 Tax=Volvox africanus TaxID=51714 RepID=A0A8J4BSZ2_9CHLO|nr:hypothetical protein Vafri_20726 [Volvox africanus]
MDRVAPHSASRVQLWVPRVCSPGPLSAILSAVEMARRLGVTRVHAKGDSKLVVQQVTGSWQIHKPHLQDLCDRVHGETRHLREFEIRHIRREYNTEADKLSNDAIDLAYRG